MTWSQQRQITYFLVFMALVLIIVGIPLFSVFHKAPTCSDNIQNGTEQGVDCGGACTRLCLALQTPPFVEWQQVFDSGTGSYSAVAYIQNPNLHAQAALVPYTFIFLDAKNNIVSERKGTTTIPAGKNFAVFEGNIEIAKDVGQVHSTFAFSADPVWVKAETVPQLTLTNQQVAGLSNTPSIDVDLENPSNTNLGKVDVTAIVYDTENNPVAVSQTYVDHLDRSSSAHLVFTWPKPFAGQVTSCQQPSDVVLDLDRSGSMASDSTNPPQPLTAVKQAALSFVDQLKTNDKAAVVSFATNASSPIDQILTSDRAAAKEAIQSITIGKNNTQYTNIFDVLMRSTEELASTRHNENAKKTIVLLTDGKPTQPTQTGVATFAADKALAAAREAQTNGIDIYTIGLGKDVDDAFLTSIAGLPERYFRAPTSKDLASVYAKIGAAICTLGPAKVEIIPDFQTQN